MIETFAVKAFKSLESVSVDLGRVNVFIGANGSGKSNLLEAIGILGSAASGRVDDAALLRRGVRPGVPALYKSSFKDTRQPTQIRFEATNTSGASYAVTLCHPMIRPEAPWTFKSEKLSANGNTIVGRGPGHAMRLEPESGYAALKTVELETSSPAVKLLSTLRDYAIFAPNTATLRGLETDAQTRFPVGLGGGGLAEAVSDLFGRGLKSEMLGVLDEVISLIGWTKGVGASPASAVPISRNVPQPKTVLRFTDRFMADGRNRLSGYDASEGALYVLFMAVLAHHGAAPPLLSVDNFDHALNPRLARALAARLCDWTASRSDRQLILTSHNPAVLDGLPLRDDSVRLFTVERSVRGKTIVNRVEVNERLLDQADNGVPLSQQWVTGTFGGVPGNI